MYPRTKAGESLYREKKRSVEVNLIMGYIRDLLHRKQQDATRFQILEFGSGQGYQTPFLKARGNLIASDIYVSDDIRKMSSDINFLQFSIVNAPIKNELFDIIYSNHVLEHIEDLQRAFLEMQRIGKSDCIYAFSVPTNIWLLLSLPAQFYNQMRRIVGIDPSKKMSDGDFAESEKSLLVQHLEDFSPRGHGAIQNYSACYKAFKISAWRSLFANNGFEIVSVLPLLLYAASEWPIIPMTRIFNRFNICSSVLFLMQKNL